MKKFLPKQVFSSVIVAVFMLLSSIVFAGNKEQAQSLYEQGNVVYKEGKFQQATELYKESYLAEAHANTAYNLGNAYFKTGQLGNAILYYKRALQAQPEFEACEQNLQIARERIIDKVDVAPRQRISAFWLSLKQSIGVSTFSFIGLFVLFLACVGAVVYVMLTNAAFKRLGFYGAIVCFVISLVAIFFAMSTVNDINNQKEGVLVISNQNVRTAPNNSSDLAFVIHEGTSFSVLQFQEGFAEIKLENGSIGWLPTNAIELV